MTEAKKRTGTTQPKPVTVDLNQPGILRVGHLLYLLKMTPNPFYRKLKAGILPAPSGRDPRPYWTHEVIRAYLNGPAVITSKGSKS
ncbi:hypothetical protein [Paraburkholderia sp. C35]|uniref:hypothetical protein n=1 Tax=Paraburkholderia sp. C35 TaxID=2126993 RepID=UPI000D6948A5|nr:hypothetical protein [Paraburkholderia sp. C35]